MPLIRPVRLAAVGILLLVCVAVVLDLRMPGTAKNVVTSAAMLRNEQPEQPLPTPESRRGSGDPVRPIATYAQVGQRSAAAGSGAATTLAAPTVAQQSHANLFSGEFALTDKLTDAGSATAEAALQTLLWAAIEQDAMTVMQMLRLSYTDRTGQEFDFTHTKALEERKQLLALESIQHASTVGGVQVVERQTIGSENVRVRLRLFHATGEVTSEVVSLRLTRDGWRRDMTYNFRGWSLYPLSRGTRTLKRPKPSPRSSKSSSARDSRRSRYAPRLIRSSSLNTRHSLAPMPEF